MVLLLNPKFTDIAGLSGRLALVGMEVGSLFAVFQILELPCPSDTYMGAKDLLSGPSPVLMLGLTGVFTMSRFPSTTWFGLVFLKHVLAV